MKRFLLALTSIAVVAVGAVAAPVLATGTAYKVQIGTLPAGSDQQITLQSGGGVSFSAGGGIGCTGSNVPATPVSTVKNSPSTNIVDLALIQAMNFTACSFTTNNFALNVTKIAPPAGDPPQPFLLHAVSGATTAATDTLSVHLDSIKLSVTASNPAICAFVLSGTLVGTYKESTKQLTLSPSGSSTSLTVSNVKGCGGLVANGQTASFTGSYTLMVAGGHTVNIKP